jgi:lysophospholipase L1-like esterase
MNLQGLIAFVGCMLLYATSFAQYRLVVLGSSTAAGAGPSKPNAAWVNRLNAQLKKINPLNEVINLAKGGYSTYHILPNQVPQREGRPAPDPKHNMTLALAYQPHAIIINMPSNDAAAGYSITEQITNYQILISWANSARIPVWVTTTQPRNRPAAGIPDLIEMKTRTHQIFGDKAIDFWSAIAAENGTILPNFDSGDGIHLNDGAHEILLQQVLDKNIPAVLSRFYADMMRF